jgi:hypothetical protein
MTIMIVAVIITLLSMVGYHRRCDNHPAIPLPCRLIFSCRKRGGGTQLRLNRNAGGGWPLSSFSSSSSSFSFSSFSSIVVGPFEAMKMMTEEELAAAAAAVAAVPEAAPQLSLQLQWRRRGEQQGSEGVTVEGSSLGKRGGGIVAIAVNQRCRKTTPFGCPGKERQGEARGAPKKGYFCGNNQCSRTLPPSLPIAQAHILRSLGGGSTNPLVAKMSMVHPGMGDVVTPSAPGGGVAEGERQLQRRGKQ